MPPKWPIKKDIDVSSKKKKRKVEAVQEKKKPFRKRFAYRFLIITLLFLVLGTAAFSWIINSHAIRDWVIWMLGGIFLFIYLLTLVLAEVMVLQRDGNLNKEYLKGRWVAFWKAFANFFRW